MGLLEDMCKFGRKYNHLYLWNYLSLATDLKGEVIGKQKLRHHQPIPDSPRLLAFSMNKQLAQKDPYRP